MEFGRCVALNQPHKVIWATEMKFSSDKIARGESLLGAYVTSKWSGAKCLALVRVGNRLCVLLDRCCSSSAAAGLLPASAAAPASSHYKQRAAAGHSLPAPPPAHSTSQLLPSTSCCLPVCSPASQASAARTSTWSPARPRSLPPAGRRRCPGREAGARPQWWWSAGGATPPSPPRGGRGPASPSCGAN